MFLWGIQRECKTLALKIKFRASLHYCSEEKSLEYQFEWRINDVFNQSVIIIVQQFELCVQNTKTSKITLKNFLKMWHRHVSIIIMRWYEVCAVVSMTLAALCILTQDHWLDYISDKILELIHNINLLNYPPIS